MGNGRYIKTLILAILLSVFSIAGYGQSARWNYVMTIEPDNGNTTEPFLDMNGLGYYDNNARFLDILAGGFISRDALSGDYPHISHYSHCANNPLSIIDPTGMFVIADVTSQQNIINTLSPEEANFISFNEQGMIDIDLLNKSASMSENFTALKALANSEINYLFYVSDKDGLGVPFFEKGEDMNSPQNYYYGVTMIPGAETKASPNDNVYIYTASFLSKDMQVRNTAHEAYGHGYFYELSKKDSSYNPFHTKGVIGYKNEYDEEFKINQIISIFGNTNLKLEEHIKLVEQQALRNYESR